jgi:hypothetical protein
LTVSAGPAHRFGFLISIGRHLCANRSRDELTHDGQFEDCGRPRAIGSIERRRRGPRRGLGSRSTRLLPQQHGQLPRLNRGRGQGGGALLHLLLDRSGLVKRVAGVDFKVEFAPRRAGEPAKIVAACDRVRSTLGWQPRFNELQSSSPTRWHGSASSRPWSAVSFRNRDCFVLDPDVFFAQRLISDPGHRRRFRFYGRL